jgi:hypothetical protein
VQNIAISIESGVDTFSVTDKDKFCNTIRDGHSSELCPRQWDFPGRVKTSYSNERQGRVTKDVSYLCDHICLHTVNTPGKWALMCWSNLHIMLILPLWSRSTQRHSKKDTTLPVINKLKEQCMACQPIKNISSEGIQKLVARWTKCFQNKGDYVETIMLL